MELRRIDNKRLNHLMHQVEEEIVLQVQAAFPKASNAALCASINAVAMQVAAQLLNNMLQAQVAAVEQMEKGA